MAVCPLRTNYKRPHHHLCCFCRHLDRHDHYYHRPFVHDHQQQQQQQQHYQQQQQRHQREQKLQQQQKQQRPTLATTTNANNIIAITILINWNAKTLGSTSIRSRSENFASDRYLIEIDARIFAIWMCAGQGRHHPSLLTILIRGKRQC